MDSSTRRDAASSTPQEFETLFILFNLRDAGLNSREIADKLNEQKLRPRTAKRWDRCTEPRIIYAIQMAELRVLKESQASNWPKAVKK